LIGDNIRTYRKEKGWSQDELAQKSGLSKISIGNYERGNRCPTLDTLQKIADALNILLSELTTDSGSEFIPNTESRLVSYLLSLGYEFSNIPSRDQGSGKSDFAYSRGCEKVCVIVSNSDIRNAFESIENFVEFTMNQLIKKSLAPPKRLD
jgi:transcriptional regulator with XRE-family HTH domain